MDQKPKPENEQSVLWRLAWDHFRRCLHMLVFTRTDGSTVGFPRTWLYQYPRIAAELRARFGLHVATSTVFSFVKVRARRRPVYALPESAPTPTDSVIPRSTQPVPRAGVRSNWLSYDPAQPLEKDPP
ncbi:MAG: hypothetical protein PSV13_14880 [Lacunisphaera sp.]|nr:hypothetical protein [Lacunisphaera sp.]